MEPVDVIRYLSIFSVGYPLVIYLSRIRKQSVQNHILGVLIVLWIVLDIVNGILFHERISNQIIFNAGHLYQFLLLSRYYYEIHFQKKQKTLWRASIVLYSGSWLVAIIEYGSASIYQSWIWTLESIVLMTYAVVYARYAIKHVNVQDPFFKGTLWIGLATFCYSCVNLGLFTVGSYVLTQMDYKVSMAFWSIHNVNNLIKNVLFAFGLASASLPNLLGNEKKQPIKF
jgi:hypothetical protein